MRVILLQNVKNVGHAGEVVEAADGFARNFLLARGLAKIADAAALRDLSAQRQARETQVQKQVKLGQILAKKLGSVSLQFDLPGSPAGTLYAGLKEFDILAKLREMVAELPQGARLVDYQTVKTAGEHEFKLELAEGVRASLKLRVNADAKK